MNYMEDRVEGLKTALGPAMVKRLEEASGSMGQKRYAADPKATKGNVMFLDVPPVSDFWHHLHSSIAYEGHGRVEEG